MVDKSRSRKEGGAGIGMALCHKIIYLHGGTLKIDSRLGEGTVMKVIFPTELPVSEDSRSARERAAGVIGAGQRRSSYGAKKRRKEKGI